MSRSRKKSPVVSTTLASSEKEDKQQANRKDRRVNKIILHKTEDDADLLDKKTTSNVDSFAKDGKYWNKNLSEFTALACLFAFI